MITAEQAQDIRQRNDKLMAWIDTIRDRHGYASYRPEDKPVDVPNVSNDERSALEVYEFVTNPPEKYFLYINERTSEATTWTGDKLGNVTFGREYKSPAIGGYSIRIPVTIKAINGLIYHGTYYKSSGSYARVKRSKKQA